MTPLLLQGLEWAALVAAVRTIISARSGEMDWRYPLALAVARGSTLPYPTDMIDAILGPYLVALGLFLALYWQSFSRPHRP